MDDEIVEKEGQRDYSENILVVLDVFKEEFERERIRSETLSTRVGTLLAACVAILTIMIQIFDIEQLADFYIISFRCVVAGGTPLLIVVASKIFVVWSCKMLLDIITPKDYRSIDYDDIKKHILSDRESLYKALLVAYQYALDNNAFINNERMKKFKKSISFVFVSLALSFLGYIVIIFMK